MKLHWANADQYYIKTDEYLRNYTFRLRPDDQDDPMRVHFRLVDAAAGEHDNVKAAEEKKRVFLLTDEDFIAEVPGETEPELVIHFEYRLATVADWPEAERGGKRNPPKQKDLIAFAEQRVLDVSDLGRWIKALKGSHVTANGEVADYSRLRAHLNRYTARNTFDYFIHKDLGSFLRRELDFFIKNEVMHLDDVENETAPRVEQYLSKIKVIRKIAGKIIDLLVQLEEFQKKLWLKKKFVVETQYCITVGSIPEAFYAEIAANEAQREEWVRLFSIDGIKGDQTASGYSKKLKPEFLRAHPTLIIDTRHFDPDFIGRLLDAVGNMDEQTDGVLFYSENFQALNLMQARFRGQVQCVYIDPPYNAPKSEIAYKNNYKHSSFLSLIEGRLNLSRSLSSVDGSHVVAIDKNERNGVFRVLNDVFPYYDNTAVTIEHNRKGVQGDHFSFTHEYALFAIPSARKTLNPMERSEVEWEYSNFRNWGGESLRTDAANCFYAVLVRDSKIVGFGNVWTDEEHHPASANVTREDGTIEIYPIDSEGVERKWRYERGTVEAIRNKLRIETSHDDVLQVKIAKTTDQFKTVWYSPRYNAGDNGTRPAREMGLPIGELDYPKSVFTTRDCIFAVSDSDALILDYFAGSGTTGQVVINLNREDGGQRKFILVEMGDYFYTVLLPRLKKVTYSPDWKDGKPKYSAKTKEAKRFPRILKVVRLESYEDTLNNLTPKRTSAQQDVLDFPEANGSDSFKEQYLLRYMLDVETRSSQSLLNIDGFLDPTSYRLKVKRPGSDESCEVNVDLLETFNWLLGLKVQRIATPQTYNANFWRDGEGRLQLEGYLKESADGPWWFRAVSGVLPDERRALILWRKRPGGETPEGMEQDNLVLEEWFKEQGFTEDVSCDLIYVNGVCQLETLKAPSDAWEIRLIEDAFRRLMFESEEV